MVASSISVVIPCYNAAPFINQTLASVLSQTHPPQEIVVVDDGSTDDSSAVAASVSSTVRVVRQPRGGDGAARNRGLAEVQSEWVAFLDADDCWRPTKLERQLDVVAATPRVVCVHTGEFRFGTDIQDEPVATSESVLEGRYTVETLLIEPLINASSALVRRSVSPRFPTWTRQGSDMLYFCELSQVGPFGYVDEPLVGYRMHPDQQTRGATAWSEHCEARLRWVEQQRDSLGNTRAEQLRHAVMQQIVDWLTLGRLNRQWDRYHALREYARSLDWGAARPAELDRRLFPRAVYALKDVFDDFRSRTSHSTARGRA